MAESQVMPDPGSDIGSQAANLQTLEYHITWLKDTGVEKFVSDYRGTPLTANLGHVFIFEENMPMFEVFIQDRLHVISEVRRRYRYRPNYVSPFSLRRYENRFISI